MNIMLLGSGGREHALAWKLTQSKLCSQLFVAPGNAGTSQFGKNVNLDLKQFSAIEAFCLKEKIDMLIIGPEEPLVNGIVDYFQEKKDLKHIKLIGPSGEGARLEGSKSFAKGFMQRHNIPTSAYREFDEANYQEGISYIQQHPLPIVLKADGLASGKGVMICTNYVEAMAEYELMIQKDKFGAAGKKVVIEQFLDGTELSVFALSDGRNYVLFPEAKDYKRAGEGDKGLNTGGMGAVSPVPFADHSFMNNVENSIIRPTIEGLIEENIDYKGFIFFGLIKVGDEPFVIEYNCRLGDPETEVVIPRLKNDLVELFVATWGQRLDTIKIEVDPRAAATIVAVSGGYPASFEKGFEIQGLNDDSSNDTMVFHAATLNTGKSVLSNGGRVLCVTSYGQSITEAVKRSKEGLRKIHFENMHYRNDIGYEFD